MKESMMSFEEKTTQGAGMFAWEHWQTWWTFCWHIYMD